MRAELPAFGYVSAWLKLTLGIFYKKFMQHSLIEKLKENLQVIYRKAVDADDRLGQLYQSGLGKFAQIFPDDVGFTVASKRFKPYVEELAKDILALEKISDGTQFEAQLSLTVRKMEQLFSTLANFQQSLKD